jgi:hypothetical protein
MQAELLVWHHQNPNKLLWHSSHISIRHRGTTTHKENGSQKRQPRQHLGATGVMTTMRSTGATRLLHTPTCVISVALAVCALINTQFFTDVAGRAAAAVAVAAAADWQPLVSGTGAATEPKTPAAVSKVRLRGETTTNCSTGSEHRLEHRHVMAAARKECS